jgi:hypothetical protein
LVFALVFLYLDGFYFVSPYLVASVDVARLPLLFLDLVISVMSGAVITVSVYEVRSLRGAAGSSRKVGILGIAAALVAGACPSYYLVPLLAVAGGVGEALAAVGIFFSYYQMPIKLASVGLLVFTTAMQEKSLRAACEVPAHE